MDAPDIIEVKEVVNKADPRPGKPAVDKMVILWL